MKKTVIFVPNYKGSVKTLLILAQYIKDNNFGIPHFIIHFEDNDAAVQMLANSNIDFSIYRFPAFVKIFSLGKIFRLIKGLIYSRRLIKRLHPIKALICATEGSVIENYLIALLNRMNIVTIVLQWAQTAPKNYYVNTCRNKSNSLLAPIENFSLFLKLISEKVFGIKYSYSYGNGDAKYFAIMGTHYREMFLQEGVPEQKLVVTGHPEHDLLYELSKVMKKPGFKQKVLLPLGIKDQKPVWIFAREAIAHFGLVPEKKDKEDIIQVLEILSKYCPSVEIILKAHPRDSQDYYQFVKEKFQHVKIIHECDLYSLIAASDLYISQISSTMLWAIALDKPVISYDFNNQPYWDYFRNKKGIVKVDSPKEMADAIQIIADTGLQKEVYQDLNILKEKYMCLDGRACARIAALINKNND